MAHFKSIDNKIYTDTSVYFAIEYVAKPTKAFKVHYSGCSGSSAEITKQFKNTRVMWNKDNKKLAHHFEQSFSDKDNITPELAHQIGVEMIDKVFPEYQVIMTTHIDTDKIHNHFIVNNVHPVTGRKYEDNKTSLKFAREESDKLCRKYKLSVIEKNEKNAFKGVDQTTYQLGIQGKSWKIQLTKDLDEALEKYSNQKEFIKFFEDRDYTIKYRDIHITFQKNGEKKGIRADTLAKQFGEKYCKSNIDKVLGVVPKITKEEYIQQKEKQHNTNKKRKSVKYKSEYERLEEKYFEFNPPMTFTKSESWTMSKNLFTKNPLRFVLRILRHIFMKRKRRTCKSRLSENYPKQPLKQAVGNKEIFACASNITYKKLWSAPGETAQIKIYAWQLPKLLSQAFFYHSFIDMNKGIATVYLKNKDLTKLAKALELTDENFFVKQNEQIQNRKTYNKLKKENEKLSYLVVTNEQRAILKEHYIQFAYFEKDDKFNIAFAPQDKKRILNLLYPEKVKVQQPPKSETAYQRNGRINAELKAAAEKTGDKLQYRIVSSTQLHNLKKTNIKFAYFRKEDGKNNIVFLSSDKEKVDKILSTKQKNTNIDTSEEPTKVQNKGHHL